MEPTCLSGGWHQPPLPGIPRRHMCNPVHHIESRIIATYSVQHRQEIGGDICLTTLEKMETFEILTSKTKCVFDAQYLA